MDNRGECSKPKKSKSDEEYNNVAQWAYLPSIVLHLIFDYLSREDRRNASTVCRQWRNSLFHPKWWSAMKFKIEHDNIPRAKFLISTFGRNVTEATVSLNSLSSTCIYEFVHLLRVFNQNNRLNQLVIEPSHCRLENSVFLNDSVQSEKIEIIDLIMAILPRLSRFSLGGLEDLALYNDCIIQELTPSKVTLLGLASIKDNINVYEQSHFKPHKISSFKNLQVLSIDFDQLSDKFLYHLEGAKDLRRIVVHLHAIPKRHKGTSNVAWRDFKQSHPGCTLRLTVIHAPDIINRLHVDVLQQDMPLSHFKAFFCEDINMDVLHMLSSFYSDTLKSVMWIDSLSNSSFSWKFTKVINTPDPFVLMSWMCAHLEELVLYGYKYPEENLVAIGRLKGSKMRKVQIPYHDIVSGGLGYRPDALKDLAKNLKDAWTPVYKDDLPPVILDPDSGDSDEFLLPYVLADLH